MTQASTRILAGASTPFQSKAAPRRIARSSPAAKKVATSITDDQRAQRRGIVQRQARMRQAGADALERGQRALALRLPQRLCDRVLRASACRSAWWPGGDGCRSHDRAGPAPARGSASGNPPAGTQRRRLRGRRKADETDGADDEGQRQPADRPRTPPGTGPRRSEDRARMRPDTLPRDGIGRPCEGLRQLQPRQSVAIADRV